MDACCPKAVGAGRQASDAQAQVRFAQQLQLALLASKIYRPDGPMKERQEKSDSWRSPVQGTPSCVAMLITTLNVFLQLAVLLCFWLCKSDEDIF